MLYLTMNKLFIYSVLFCVVCISHAQKKPRFIHLEYRISDHTYQSVSMAQDTLGYMWISHIKGISKYNGYGFEFIPYKEIFHKERQSDKLDRIICDSQGTIWIVSQNGEISKTNKKGGFSSLSQEGGMFQSHMVSQFLATENQNWIATKSGKILSYDLKEETLVELTTLPVNLQPIISRGTMVLSSHELYLISTRGELFVYDMTTDRLEEIDLDTKGEVIFNTGMILDGNQRLWIATNSPNLGPMIYDIQSKEFIQNDVLKVETLEKMKENFSSIFMDSKGTIWAGTDGNGLYKINPETGELSIFNYDIFDSASISSNTVIDIFEDRLQNLWIANNYGEINVLSNKENDLIHYHSGAIKNSPSVVMASYKEKDGTLWFGTDGKGMVRVSPDGSEKQYLVNEDFSNGFYIENITADDIGNLWVSSQVNGVWIFDKKSGTAEKLILVDNQGVKASICLEIFKDSKKRMWIRTGQGVFVYDAQRRFLANFKAESAGSLSENLCGSIAEDEQGYIWLGFPLGLYQFNEDLQDFSNSTLKRATYPNETVARKGSVLLRDIVSVENKLWMLDLNGDLLTYSKNTKEFFFYKDDPRFTDVDFKSIEVQNSNNLWIGSNKGLWHLDLVKDQHTTYFKSDGFLDDAFLKSSYKDSDGNLYFGSRIGINYFSPKELTKKRPSAKLFIEGIEILNKPAVSIIPDQIHTTVQNIGHIDLDHDQASFSFNYVALDNVLSPSFHYAHRLVGYDDNWTNSDTPSKASYTNILPGDYEFHVRAGTNRGNWDLGQKTIRVHVAAPFYKQNWAIVLYILIALTLIYALYRWVSLKNRLITEELNHQADKTRYDLKMNFFAKISHEIQTPLTLILIPIENMMENAAKSGNELLQKRLKMISNNARRLSRIVFELTTVRNKELKQLKLNVAEYNIVKEVKEIASSFKEQAELKKIDFQTTYPKKDFNIWYDKDKIEHVLYNLFSNAFKFTPEGGSVKLSIWENLEEEKVMLSIKDTGPGIPKESLKHIFELFYQVETGKKYLGMGIGLALVKELIDLHHGSIEVTSNSEKGTCFTIGLLMKESTFSAHEKLNTGSSIEVANTINHRYEHVEVDHISDDFTKTILIVEDNFELQDYLKKIFGEYFNVLTANNGMKGFELAKKQLPNLILSDIMMPELDGIEMTKMLRKNLVTAHIPVILLTAEKTQVNKIMALQVGAIEYLNKPFNVNELILKTNNIITRGDRLKSKFKSDLLGTPKQHEVKSKDETFLENLVELIEKHMANPDFKVEELSKDLHISYSVIYKKFQRLTGKTIVDFVRSMRLRKAAMYLTESNFSVAESAFSVGFNDPKYFSKCFKNEFGVSPFAYKKRYLENQNLQNSPIITPEDMV